MAWQGTGNWTADALAKAKQQGYDTVIATHDFEEDDAATAETGKTVVTTDAGDITVLTAQSSAFQPLSQGKATSADAEADGEGTTAGASRAIRRAKRVLPDGAAVFGTQSAGLPERQL